MKNKRLFIICLVFILTGCRELETQEAVELKTQSFEELYEGNLQKVDKMTIKSGQTGELRHTVDQDIIDVFLDDLKEVQFIPDDDQGRREGYTYWITLFEGEKQYYFYPSLINGYYASTSPDIHPIIEELFTEMNDGPITSSLPVVVPVNDGVSDVIYDIDELITDHAYYNNMYQLVLENTQSEKASRNFIYYLEALKLEDIDEIKKYNSFLEYDFRITPVINQYKQVNYETLTIEKIIPSQAEPSYEVQFSYQLKDRSTKEMRNEIDSYSC